MTIAERLLQDPRIAKAKQLLIDAVRDHQQAITSVRPPKEELKVSYHKLLEQFTQARGGKLWYPYLGSGIGKGALVELLDGSVKYDFISGIGPHYWGHSNLELVASSVDAAISDTVMQGNLQQNGDTVELCQLLTHVSGLAHCFLTTSGVMANENALKLAFQKKFPANRVLAFSHCFAGRTLATSQITDKPGFREGLPPTLQVDYVPFYDPKRPEESTREAVRALLEHTNRYPKAHAVMIFELVQGEGGFNVGTRAFFKTLMELCRSLGIAVFADEVQTFGRLPKLFGYQYFELDEYVDLSAIGKLSQVCATLFTDAFKPRAGLLSQTFTGSTSAIRAALVMIRSLVNDHYFGKEGKIEKIHHHFVKHLQRMAGQHPGLIEGPFGIGAMVAFTPYGGDGDKVNHLMRVLFDAGIIGFVAGSHPTRVRFLLPAGAVTAEDIDAAAEILERVLLENR